MPAGSGRPDAAGASGPSDASAAIAPTCYRHPDRETHIRCARCARPICPECMIPASVGFQCPDDVRAGAATGRAARTSFGARVRDGVGQSTLVTRSLMAACGVMFVLQVIVAGLTENLELTSPEPAYLGVVVGESYRLLTAVFLHGGLLHLGFNLYALWVFGPVLETMLGRTRFLALYLVSGLAGTAVSYCFASPNSASLGASGAIFGLFAVMIFSARKLGFETSQLVVLLGINVAIGFTPGANIDWHAHAGGFAAGTVFAGALRLLALDPQRRGKRLALARWSFAATAVLVTMAAVGAVAARTASVQDTSATRVIGCNVAHPRGGEGFLSCLSG